LSKRKKKGNKRKNKIIVVVLREPKPDVCNINDSEEKLANCKYENWVKRVKLWAIRLLIGYVVIDIAYKFEIFSLVENHWETLEPTSFVLNFIFLLVIAVTRDPY